MTKNKKRTSGFVFSQISFLSREDFSLIHVSRASSRLISVYSQDSRVNRQPEDSFSRSSSSPGFAFWSPWSQFTTPATSPASSDI